MYFATRALLGHRPCLMIAESGAPARANPTWPLWPENPSPKLAACAAALIRRLTVLAVITKTYGLPSQRRCRSPSKAFMARRVMNTTSPV